MVTASITYGYSLYHIWLQLSDSAWVAYSSQPVEWDCSESTLLNFTVRAEAVTICDRGCNHM